MASGHDSRQFLSLFDQNEENTTDLDDEDDNEYGTDDEDMFSTTSVDLLDGDPILDENEQRPDDQEVPLTGIATSQNDAENTDVDPFHDPNEDNLQDDTIPSGKSIAHHYLHRNAAYVSFDVETGGEYCGIVQISAEIFRIRLENGSEVGEREVDTFNYYVKPSQGAIWSDAAMDIHKLRPTDSRISSADDIATVWVKFCAWIDKHIPRYGSQKGIMVAWNGESCDLRWIYKLTQAPRSSLSLPPQLVFFLDPLKVIRKYKSCSLHTSKSKLDSYSLGVVWKHIDPEKKNLEGAHDSLVDVKAQTDVVLHKDFVKFINRKESIRTMDVMLSKREQSDLKKEMEPLRPVHEPWVELDENSEAWEPPQEHSYTGSQSGGKWGPTSAITKVATATGSTLAQLFFFFFTITLFKEIVKMTDKYAYKDWVLEKKGTDRDGIPKKKSYFVQCPEPRSGQRRPAGARHRAGTESIKFPITLGYMIVWFGVVIMNGSLSKGGSIRQYYEEAPYGVSCPIIQNAISRNAFEFMRRYLHFVDNARNFGKDKLFKVRSVMNTIMENLRKGWTAGQRVAIDESMIKYMGRAIAFVQYMPRKPIKHGIKVFCMCCAMSAYMLAFEIYCGKDDDVDGSAIMIVERLILDANLSMQRGRILYTDNWYTSIALAKHLYESYSWTIVGTISPTEKKDRTDHDVPFLKLSNGALIQVERGWYREATLKVKAKSGRVYYVQCTTWRDKKQVMFVHTNVVGPSSGLTVMRHLKGKKRRVELKGTNAQRDYSKHFNAVDRNDRDSSDYSVTLRTIRWYLRIFFWVLDRVVFSCYLVVVFLYKSNVGKDEWKKYISKNGGRRKFQIDLGMALINYGIGEDWKAPYEENKKPRWMRQKGLKPCECNQCFFCLNGMTNGIHHKQKVTVVSPGGRKKRDLDVKQCSSELQRIRDKSKYCRMCYRNQPAGLSIKKKKESCTASRFGCPSCDEPICKKCWNKGYDLHQKKSPSKGP